MRNRTAPSVSLVPASTALLAALLLPLLLAACAAPAPPRGARAPQQPVERWRPVPAKADGVAVPGGRRHLVKRGETGIAIASAYGVNWSRIAQANRIGRDSILHVGQPLFIPIESAAQANRVAQTARTPPRSSQTTRRPAPPRTPEESAAAFRLDVDDLITGSAPAQTGPAQTAAARSAAPPPAPQARISSIPALAWPVDGRVLLSTFGPKQGGRVNDGINIRTLRGATVRAAADGQVIYVGDAIAGFGLMLLVRHGPPGPEAIVTAYGHLETALVERGARVERGQPIARAGSSGAVTEPQLLFQLRQGRRAINPQPYLS